jgi:hypothetical protein
MADKNAAAGEKKPKKPKGKAKKSSKKAKKAAKLALLASEAAESAATAFNESSALTIEERKTLQRIHDLEEEYGSSDIC